MKSSKKSTSIGDAIREGIRATKPYLFSHHETPDGEHCFHIGSTYLCGRCTGIGIALILILAGVDIPLWTIYIVPAFALTDYAFVHALGMRGNPSRAATTGVLLGTAYVTGIANLFTAPLLVLGTGSVYAGTAVIVLQASHS